MDDLLNKQAFKKLVYWIMLQPEWIFPEGTPDEAYLDFFGFTYLIKNLITGRLYVGRKYFVSRRNRVIRESDWRQYWGSCLPLLEDIAQLGVQNFERRILTLCHTRGHTNYEEAAEQFRRDVLHARFESGERMYYNQNILSRYFAGIANETEATRKKKSNSLRGNQNGKGNKGKPKSKEHRANIGKSNIGRKVSESQRAGHKATMSARWHVNNGSEQRLIKSDEAQRLIDEEGWIRGRLKWK